MGFFARFAVRLMLGPMFHGDQGGAVFDMLNAGLFAHATGSMHFNQEDDLSGPLRAGLDVTADECKNILQAAAAAHGADTLSQWRASHKDESPTAGGKQGSVAAERAASKAPALSPSVPCASRAPDTKAAEMLLHFAAIRGLSATRFPSLCGR